MESVVFYNKISSCNSYLKQNRSLMLLTLVMMIGIIAGAWSIQLSSDDSFYGIRAVFNDFYETRAQQKFFTAFLYSLSSYLLVLATCYICGMSTVGCAAAFFIIFYHGYRSGLLSGYLYAVYASGGIGFYSLILLPGLLITSYVYIFACRETFRFSLLMCRMFGKNNAKTGGLLADFKKYSYRFIFFLVFIFLAAVVDSIMSSVFFDFFKF